MTQPAIRVLLAEDVAADTELEVRELKRAGLRVAHRVVYTEESFVAALHEFLPDIILSDFAMPGFDGMEALALARERAPEVPFVFVSGTIGEEYAIRALKNGATDYVLKTNLVRLPAAVERALAEAKERREQRRLRRIRELMGELNAAMVRVRERAALFDAFCRIAVERGGFHSARVVERARGQEQGEPAWSRKLLQAAFDERRIAVSNEVALEGVHSAACLPCIVEGAAPAAVLLHARERDFFDAEELRLLEELGSNLSFALELIAKQDRITYLALYDPLTGLPNRTLFHERLTQAIGGAQPARSAIALALIDVERFKAINDTLGRPAGDRVLRAVAQRIQQHAGEVGPVARLGNDLFAVVFAAISGAQDIARRLEDTVGKVFAPSIGIDAREVRVAAKAGIAIHPEDGADPDALFRNAEAALKRAKETGERYLFYAPEINARIAEQVELEARLRRAVERGELFFHYQPKFDLVTGRLTGLEALMRWNGAEGSPVPPTRFIPVLEQTGLILEAGAQAIAAASRTYRGWRARGLKPPRIAVNVSALQLRRRSFVADVRAALGEAADDGGVDFEITESLLMNEVDESIGKLQELRRRGHHIALDDFGTGYSSLAYLSRLPLDALKIDRGFVHGMTGNAGDTNIVSAIISLAHGLHLDVVAEGVETEEQADLLRLLMCDQAQGNLLSPPLPPERIEAMLDVL